MHVEYKFSRHFKNAFVRFFNLLERANYYIVHEFLSILRCDLTYQLN